MSLKKLVEDLLTEVNEAHTKVAYSARGVSAYALFSSWPEDEYFKPIYQIYFELGHTTDDLLDKCVVVFRIIRRMHDLAKVNYDWATSASVGRITGEDQSAAATILDDIKKHLDEANAVYLRTTYTELARQFSAASGSLLVLGPALAQLKALSMPCQGCDCNCACAACETCASGTETIRKKPQAGCRCRACFERSTTHKAP